MSKQLVNRVVNKYWAKRQAKIQEELTNKSIEETEKQLQKYYSAAMQRVIFDFEATYSKLLAAVEQNKEITPAWLYRLDSYWQMQGQLKNELQKLGDKQATLLSKKFVNQFLAIYKSVALESDTAFSTISKQGAMQLINQIWCADGKSWSQRIWNNTDKLQQALNDGLVHCVITGKKPTELKKLLQDEFNVSYNRADALVRTEMAHIETQAAAQRYKDYGLQKYEYLGREEHDIGCKCKELNGKTFLYAEMSIGVNAPPLHPRCRCSIIPVIE